MATNFRTLAISAASIAMLAGTAVVPLPSQAVTPPPSVNITVPNYSHTARVSPTEYKALRLSAKLKKQTRGQTLDYRKAKKIFGKGATRASWRRQYTAGWKTAGGKTSHVSKAERKKIEAERKKYQPKSAIGTLAKCEGKSGYVRLDPSQNDYFNLNYFDSCETNKLTRNIGWCVGIAGGIAMMIPHPAVVAIMSLFVTGCGGTYAWVIAARDNSSLRAVIVKTGNVTKAQPANPTPQNPVRYQVPVRIVPQ
jgi:hypothetical protein